MMSQKCSSGYHPRPVAPSAPDGASLKNLVIDKGQLTILVDGFDVVGGVQGVKLVAGGRPNGEGTERCWLIH